MPSARTASPRASLSVTIPAPVRYVRLPISLGPHLSCSVPKISNLSTAESSRLAAVSLRGSSLPRRLARYIVSP